MLARNTIWNLVGEGAPLLIAVIAIPVLVRGLGTERFGILLIVWLLIGYLSLFDLGVGRALTNLVAQKLGAGEEDSLPPLIWTANILMFGVGIVGGLVLAVISHWLAYSILKIPAALKDESLVSLYLLSAALPAVISSTGFRGVLEAYQRFDAANAVRIPMGILSFAGPLVVLPFSHSLVPVVAVLGVGRYAAMLAYFLWARSVLPVMRSKPKWHPDLLKPLMTFGGWMTISNIIAPVMTGMDRFFLGAIVSMQAVTYYATPYEIVTKVLNIPIALSGVLFPAFSATLISDPARTRRIYLHAQRMMAIVLGPMIALIIISAHLALKVWLGPDFADNSALAMRVLALGIFLNGMTYIPVALVQGASHPSWIAKLHLIELPLYLAVFWTLTWHFGILGAALSWLLRALAEFIALTIFAERLSRGQRQSDFRKGFQDFERKEDV